MGLRSNAHYHDELCHRPGSAHIPLSPLTHMRFSMQKLTMGRVLSAYFLLAMCPAASADLQLSFTTIDVPGALGTDAIGVWNGQVVGVYEDSSGVSHGYLWSASGNFTAIDVPGTSPGNPYGTRAYGISAGQIVGAFDGNNMIQGYVRSADGTTYTPINVPGASYTEARGIDGGQIVGLYQDNQNPSYHGFILNPDGSFTTLNVPGAQASEALGISNGQVAGFYVDGNGNVDGFLRDAAGDYTTLDVAGALSTQAFGISDGQVVGLYTAVSGTEVYDHGFLLDSSGNYTTIDVPGALDTEVFGIYDGEIVGDYVDSNGQFHGFMAVPVPEMATNRIAICSILLGLAYCQRRHGRNGSRRRS